MPDHALRPCAQHGCPGLTRAKYCPLHEANEQQEEKQYARERGGAAKLLNGKMRGARKVWLAGRGRHGRVTLRSPSVTYGDRERSRSKVQGNEQSRHTACSTHIGNGSESFR